MKDKTKTLLTGEIQVTPFDSSYNELDRMMFLSKNLYNACLYTERQKFFEKRDSKDSSLKGFLTNFELSKNLQDEDNPDYRALPSAVSQQVCKQVYLTYKSFFSLFKKGMKPKLPKYLDKEKGRNKLSFTKNAFSQTKLKSGIIKFIKFDCTFKLPEYIEPESVQQIDIIKTQNRTIKILIIYSTDKVPLKEDNNRVLGIDLGLNNLMSVVSNTNDFKPLIYDGKYLKSVNQFCNKQVSNLQSLSKNLITKRICSIYRNRINKINSCLHRYSSDLINQAVSNNFNTIVIGKNTSWKQEINLGRRNNQNFVYIPFNNLIDKIKYKASLKGINVIETEESYTSKCSFFDNEFPCKHDIYQGKRIHRGLFKSSKGTINADLNGALNIIRKVFKDFSRETANLSIDFFKTIVKVSPKSAVYTAEVGCRG